MGEPEEEEIIVDALVVFALFLLVTATVAAVLAVLFL